MLMMMRFALLAFVLMWTATAFGDRFSRNQAITFLSARSGWRIYESNSLTVNPNLSITPLIYSPNPNQRAVLVRFNPDPAVDPIPALATVGTSTTNIHNRQGSRNRGYDLDSVVIAPGIEQTSGANQTVPTTPITLTFLPVVGQVTGQCMVARINTGSSTTVNDVITNVNRMGGSTCATFVRNSTDTSLLDVREIRKCELTLRKCSRLPLRVGREDQILFELTTLKP
ncbi:hypothetical protein BIW11_13492 [Tropilaelaps mercedesae]|uniref:Uncharacterized protein n=1 Tax=Tropilaelaps mercedesae TaxID=418985 RepID=A0A1V9X2K5_9ACAR|nr:hypothetical protein BIW11_13492 [Tropilaelaps mercedesae]